MKSLAWFLFENFEERYRLLLPLLSHMCLHLQFLRKIINPYIFLEVLRGSPSGVQQPLRDINKTR